MDVQSKAPQYIHGASDDLLCFGGGISDEYGCYDAKGLRVGASDGTVMLWTYGKKSGEWKVDVLTKGKLFAKVIPSEGEDSDRYTDVVEFSGEVEWFKVGKDKKLVR